MRALAKKAGVSPSHLCRAMNGETKVSAPMAYKIAKALELSRQEAQEFINLAGLESLDGVAKENLLNDDQKKLQKVFLNLELFEIVSDWHYFAIYELIKAQPKKSFSKWIAKRLGLSLLNTKIAISKLEQANFIRKNSLGYYEACSEQGIYAGNDIPHVAIKNHHRQVSRKAIEAVDLPVDEREFQSIQFGFDRKQIKKAQQKIRSFINEFESEFATKRADDIYQMNLQLFSLTKKG